MLNQLKNNSGIFNMKNVIIGAIGLASAAIAGYFVYTSIQQDKTPTKTVDIEIKEEVVQESPEKTLIRVINSIKRQVQNRKNLTIESTKAIYKSQFQLSQRQFIPLTLKNRQGRRKQYLELFQLYEEELAKLHDRHLNAVLAHFKIDKADWIQSVEQLSTNDPQFLLDMEYGQLDVLRKIDMPKAKFALQVEISKYKVKLLEEKGQIFREIDDIEISDLVNLIERWIYDQIYLKYKFEIEDLNYSKNDLSNEEKVDLLNHEDNYREILSAVVSGDEDEDEDEGSNSSGNAQ